MCGICGQFNFLNGLPVDPEDIKKMTRSMLHRGPDDEGYFFNRSIGLGFRRLSIIDLAGGHQPMTDSAESVRVVFNGEIYNFREIRNELEGYGHVFRSQSDTEVIIHGYKQWGPDVLQHLNGMFGLAIWDEKEQLLMLARDRMGIKPLYYKLESDHLLFASEIRSLLACLNEKTEMDLTAAALFMRFRYTPSPLTLFQGIRKLAAGTRLIVDNGVPRIERWWNYKPELFDPMPAAAQAEEELADLYRRAVRRHLISDVPVGLLLSGGLDSGLLLALMKESADSWKTFTVGFGGSFRDDELAAASYTAKAFNVPNFQVRLGQDMFQETLSKIVKTLEEPVTSPSIVAMYHLCKRARQDVKVALIGQGPDELFGGYVRHIGVRYGVYWRILPIWLRHIVESGLSRLSRNEAIKRSSYSLATPDRMQRYREVFSLMPVTLLNSLFKNETFLLAGKQSTELWDEFMPLMKHTDELGGFQFLEIRSSLPDELLMYADKLSMAHSLEVRVPYLDKEIVEYVERLPAEMKVRRFTRKWLHKMVCRHQLPDAIVKRRKKGFAAPVDEWLRASVNGKMHEVLLDEKSLIYKHMRSNTVKHLVDEHRAGKRNNYKILFNLIALEEWMRSYLS